MKHKTLGQVKQDVQKVVNRYIRLRDEGKPCISCGQTKKLQAGHYFPVKGYDGLRFDEDNIHGECSYCNCWNQTHLIGYTNNLKKRIGGHRYFNLVEKSQAYKRSGYKFTRAELDEIKRIYLEKISKL